jgi:hypothetical protein
MERSSSSDIVSIAGVWDGHVWEMPTHYLQGVRRITVNVNKDGSWTATSAGAVFDTSFKARATSAMIDLERVREPLPAAAQTQP